MTKLLTSALNAREINRLRIQRRYSMSKNETPTAAASAWDLRHPGCVMRGANGEEIHEFLGMWPLKPDADLVGLAKR
jgi:hypothetical protein